MIAIFLIVMVFWCSYKMKKHTLEALTQDKWNKLIGKLPICERLNQMFLGLDDGDYSYYAEQNQRLYKVHHREGSSLLNVSQWCGYRQDSWHGDRIEPIVVEDNVGRHNIYAVTFLNNPIAKKKVEKWRCIWCCAIPIIRLEKKNGSNIPVIKCLFQNRKLIVW